MKAKLWTGRVLGVLVWGSLYLRDARVRTWLAR